MKPENRPKIVFEGQEYDDYQATQKQREIERTIREVQGVQQSRWTAGAEGENEGALHLTHGQRTQPYIKPAVADHVPQYKGIIEGEMKG